MKNSRIGRRAALAATVGFAGLALFQLLLAAGRPLGAAAGGGTDDGQLPTSLRVGSGMAIVVYGVAAAVILVRAGFNVRFIPCAVAGVGSWVLVALLTLGALANFASQNPWKRFLLGPVTLLLAGLCLVVARSPEGALRPRPGSGRSQLRDPQLQIARGRGQGPRPGAVALRGPLRTAFPRAGTDHRGELGVDQRLVDRLCRGPDPVLDSSGLHGFEHLE